MSRSKLVKLPTGSRPLGPVVSNVIRVCFKTKQRLLDRLPADRKIVMAKPKRCEVIHIDFVARKRIA